MGHCKSLPKDVTGIEDCPGVESVFPTVEEEEVDEEEEEEVGPSICRVLTEEDFGHLMENKTALVYLMQLKTLANKKVDSICKVKECGEGIEISIKHVGSAVYLKWICRNTHIADKWCSQPILNRGLHGGDLMFASSILFSGNNFNKMELFAKFLQMGFPSQSSFTRLQRQYLVPSVDELWSQKQEELIAELFFLVTAGWIFQVTVHNSVHIL
ncbi:uncharacterized protein LOC133192340 [Saccostrea echinata]|uniref:uncharacterized protein LOC133192340 n=1 Tax=Saccostrea echinata TaxID=191078 RepID=UPI002A83AD95|nr:uncharacterized protein LOC133192340 [Saccostrea echinata]